jgi:hypothetical protein
MGISPNEQEKLAEEIRRLYADSENELLKMIARRTEKGIDTPGWQERKLVEIRAYRKEVENEIKKLNSKMPNIIRRVIEDSYVSGIKSAISDLKYFSEQTETPEEYGLQGEFSFEELTAINQDAIRAFARATIDRIAATHVPILRRSEDIYRNVVVESAGTALTGTETRRQVAQRVLNRFASQGITGFKDNAGRNWDIASYAEMATRASIGQASIQGHVDRMKEYGRDLVIVSDHPEECGICRPWEGRVLSISGNDPDYPTLSDARGAGLFHPGCGHVIGAWIKGLSKPIHAKGDPEGYEIRQQQRYHERQIRLWKKREAVAITEQDKLKARAKVREWQKINKEFVEKHDRRRKYERESITGAR